MKNTTNNCFKCSKSLDCLSKKQLSAPTKEIRAYYSIGKTSLPTSRGGREGKKSDSGNWLALCCRKKRVSFIIG
jgi:hypothetical protein